MSKERIALWDNVKFLLMITVVVGHLIDHDISSSHLFRSGFIFIYSFHMPLFIFISGLFHKNKNIKEKAVSYFSIYFVLKICFSVLKMITHKKLEFELFSEYGVPWFLFASAVFIIITYLLRDFDKKYILVISVILGLFCGYDKNIGDFLVLSRIIVFYPFYLLGTMVSKEKIEALAKKLPVKALAGAVILAWGAVCFFLTDKVYLLRPLLTGRNPFNSRLIDYGFLYRAGVYAVAVIIGLCFVLITPTVKIGKITSFGQRTLQVYFWHDLIVEFAFAVGVFELFSTQGVLKLVWALLGIPLTLILSLNVFKHPVNCLMYRPKKEIE